MPSQMNGKLHGTKATEQIKEKVYVRNDCSPHVHGDVDLTFKTNQVNRYQLTDDCKARSTGPDDAQVSNPSTPRDQKQQTLQP